MNPKYTLNWTMPEALKLLFFPFRLKNTPCFQYKDLIFIGYKLAYYDVIKERIWLIKNHKHTLKFLLGNLIFSLFEFIDFDSEESLLCLFSLRENLSFLIQPTLSILCIHLDSWSLTNKKWVIWSFENFKNGFNFAICLTEFEKNNNWDSINRSRAYRKVERVWFAFDHT